MFSKKNKEVKKDQTQNYNSGQRNVIAAGTVLVGDLKSDGDFRIDGTIEGTIETKGRIVIGQSGVITGNVICDNSEVEGKVSGQMKVNDLLSLKSTAVINGDVFVNKLAIEPGAIFDANCNMQNGVKDLKTNFDKKVEKSV
jgi:cytoskeletal protein CcmA (bactofilin family)